MIATISGIPDPGISFENGSLIGEHSLFICFVLVNLACIMARTHNKNMECNDCARAVTGFFPDFANVYSPDVQVVKMCRVR